MQSGGLPEEMRNESVDELMAFCSIASVTDDAHGCREAAEFLISAMERRGITTKLIPTELNPAIFGIKEGVSNRTLLFYSHYDVVPPGSLDSWHSPPFTPTIRDDRLWARGVADHKGNIMARLQALDLLEARGEPLPITVMFLIEGNEEVGSPGLRNVLRALSQDLSRAEGGYYSGWSRDLENRPRINAGMRGDCVLHVELSNSNRDLHASFGSLVRDPLLELVQLLTKLVDGDGRPAVPNFFSGVRPLSDADRAALERIPFDVDRLRETFGVQRFIGSATDPTSLVSQQFFGPVVSVYDIQSTGVPGTGVPASASAYIRASLVPDQDPKEVADAIESFLRANTDLPITITRGQAMRPARAELDSTAVDVAVKAARQALGREPVLYPLSSGVGPRGLFVEEVGLPLVADAGVSHAESNDHAANENIFLSHYLQGIEQYAQILQLWPTE